MGQLDMALTKPINGFDGRYLVDTQGNIWHVYKTCIRQMKAYKNSRGILVVGLTGLDGKKRQYIVHLLVADAFLPPRPPGYVVCHRNGDRGDPCLTNLWIIKSQELGKLTGHKARRKAVAKFDWRTQDIVEVYRSARQAAKANYMSYQTIIDRCNGKVKGPIAPDGYIYQWDN